MGDEDEGADDGAKWEKTYYNNNNCEINGRSIFRLLVGGGDAVSSSRLRR